MPDLALAPETLETARTGVAAEARRMPAMIDGVVAPSAGLGRLASAGDMFGALVEVVRALDGDLGAAGTHLDQLDRALDATLGAVQDTDRSAGSVLGSVA